MKRAVYLFILLFLTSLCISAQSRRKMKPPTPPTIEERVKKLDKKLKLTAEQKIQVLEFFHGSRYEKLTNKLNADDLSRDKMREIMKDIKAETDKH